jgi:CheY-like chemotaxis protein
VWVSAGYAPDGVVHVAALLAPQPFELGRAGEHTVCGMPAADADSGTHGKDGDAHAAGAAPHTQVAVAGMAVYQPPPSPASSVSARRPSGNAALSPSVDSGRWLDALWRWRGRRRAAPRTRQPGVATPASPTDGLAGPLLWVKVADTGIGMTAEQLAVVIEPFQQADDTTTRRFGGSGLGLAICHELVELLGGTMVYASSPGVGSVFLVALPCTPLAPPPGGPSLSSFTATATSTASSIHGANGAASLRSIATVHAAMEDAAASQPSPAPGLLSLPAALALPLPASVLLADPGGPPGAAPGSRPVVLIADDNPLNIQVLRRQLLHLGCDSVVATNGAECVAAVERYWAGELPRLDVVFMDLHMPVMDGLAGTRRVRAREQARGAPPAARLPIVAVSAEDPETQRAQCDDAGLNDYLRKPVVLRDLRQLLDRIGIATTAPG